MGYAPGFDSSLGRTNRQIRELQEALREERAARRLELSQGYFASTWRQKDLNSVDLTSQGGYYCGTRVKVPEGFTRMIMQIFTSTGVTMSGTSAGNVASAATGSRDGTILFMGSTISNGVVGGGPVSVSAFFAYELSDLPDDGTAYLDLYAYAHVLGGPAAAGSGNVHLSASIIFAR